MEENKRGGRNLFWLGLVSVMVAVITTSVSLVIYHNSGDIYLDRSRPGYLPDEDEINNREPVEDEYLFEESGEITIETINKYLEELDKNVTGVDSYIEAFNADVLSDKNLEIEVEK